MAAVVPAPGASTIVMPVMGTMTVNGTANTEVTSTGNPYQYTASADIKFMVESIPAAIYDVFSITSETSQTPGVTGVVRNVSLDSSKIDGFKAALVSAITGGALYVPEYTETGGLTTAFKAYFDDASAPKNMKKFLKEWAHQTLYNHLRANTISDILEAPDVKDVTITDAEMTLEANAGADSMVTNFNSAAVGAQAIRNYIASAYAESRWPVAPESTAVTKLPAPVVGDKFVFRFDVASSFTVTEVNTDTSIGAQVETTNTYPNSNFGYGINNRIIEIEFYKKA